MRILRVLALSVLSFVLLVGTRCVNGQPMAPATTPASVAILVFDGVQIIDYTGPYEVFGQAGLRVFMVAAAPGPITTSMDMKVVPTYTLADAPAADVLVVPGGGIDGARGNPQVIAWIRERAGTARHVLSVCNGAFLLAEAGLLDGLTATTFYDLIPELERSAPKTRVVSDQRFVDNGKVVTTAGLSSGIDGSLHVVEEILGKGRAQQVALNMEYHWQPESGFARAGLADRHLRRLFGRNLRLQIPGGEWKVLATEGGTDQWQVDWELRTATPRQDLEAALAKHLADTGGWIPSAAPAAGAARAFRFTDEAKRPWNARAEIRPMTEGSQVYRMTIRIERAGA